MVHLSNPLKHEARILLGHVVGALIIRRDILDDDVLASDKFPEEMPFDVKVTGTARDAMVVGK